MPACRVHETIAKIINEDYNFDEKLLRVGTIAPDCWRNVPEDSVIKDKYLSHFWDFRIKSGQANDYEHFYIKYYDKMNNPFYFGYLIHLIVDQYWKTNIDKRYEKKIDGIHYLIDNNGNLVKDEDYTSYYEGIKMQKRLAKKYDLDYLPTDYSYYEKFNLDIDKLKEIDKNGLFGDHGTINYDNTILTMSDDVPESIYFDDASIDKAINETVIFVRSELKRLKDVKKEYDSKIKIAVDIDDTILSTKELEDYYWNVFLDEHPEIDRNKNYSWGDLELSLFWSEYRDKMAYGQVKDGVSDALDKLLDNNYVVDLLSARPIDKYASLDKNLAEYFEKNNVNYSNINLGFYDKYEFLKEQKYDVFIDNELRHIRPANESGIFTILYGPKAEDYDGLQTDDWSNIPNIINKKFKNNNKKRIRN